VNWRYAVSIKSLLSPKSIDPDVHRKELILNSLLGFCIPLAIIFSILTFNHERYATSYIGCINFLVICAPFFASYYFSRKGNIALASTILITTFSVGTLKSLLTWSILLPSTLLSIVLIVILTGILISSRAGFIYATMSGLVLYITNTLAHSSYISFDLSWRDNRILTSDIVTLGVFLLFMSGISWISNRQTQLSLIRARKSEAELKIERDSLEIKVDERTREIQQMQIDKLSQLYTFIEFGKISAGLIHDLMSPLNAISLELEMRENQPSAKSVHTYEHIDTVNPPINNSINYLVESSRKIQSIISATRRQIKTNLVKERFHLKETISECLLLQNHRIKKNAIELQIRIDDNIAFYGYQSLFAHIITNLLSNAIDACEKSREIIRSSSEKTSHKIRISIRKVGDEAQIAVRDNGIGIPSEISARIFEPFYSTKGESGCGYGLSASKYIAEKYFDGTITLKSDNRTYQYARQSNRRSEFKTVFTFSFPLEKGARRNTI